MENLRDLRRRIRAIRSTQQITHSMKLVSTARFSRIQGFLSVHRQFAQEFEEAVSVLPFSRVEHPLLYKRSGGKILIVPITSDRGLCGAYNVNLLRFALSFASSLPPEKEVFWLPIGRKGILYLQWRKHPIIHSFQRIPISLPLKAVSPVASYIQNLYEKENFEGVHLFYTRFVSMGKQIPQHIPLLPIVPPERKEEKEEMRYIYEPDGKEMVTRILSRLLEVRLHQALFESFTSEQAARMLAMSQASENAEELIRQLTLRYNRARQESITKELMDIVGGAEALKL
ncbi:MAG: ATP synthase F1 subunit gamma [bacterium JZ-2024 1]